MQSLLDDKDTYARITKNPGKQIENKLTDILRKWHTRSYIDKKDVYKLRSSDGMLPKAYGVPKIHKQNNPLRIIISYVNTPLYKFATCICTT